MGVANNVWECKCISGIDLLSGRKDPPVEKNREGGGILICYLGPGYARY